jgi:hypothetical protein
MSSQSAADVQELQAEVYASASGHISHITNSEEKQVYPSWGA